MMSETSIRDRLVEHGQKLLRSGPKQLALTTGNQAADALVNDIAKYPHAFVLACVMNRRVKAEKALIIPYRISEKIGGFPI
jgi:endonuclease III